MKLIHSVLFRQWNKVVCVPEEHSAPNLLRFAGKTNNYRILRSSNEGLAANGETDSPPPTA